MSGLDSLGVSQQFQTILTAVSDSIDRLSEKIDLVSDNQADFATKLDDIGGDLNALRSRYYALDTAVQSIESDVAALQTTVNGQSSSINVLNQAVADVGADITGNANALADLQSDVSAIEADIADNANTLEELKELIENINTVDNMGTVKQYYKYIPTGDENKVTLTVPEGKYWEILEGPDTPTNFRYQVIDGYNLGSSPNLIVETGDFLAQGTSIVSRTTVIANLTYIERDNV